MVIFAALSKARALYRNVHVESRLLGREFVGRGDGAVVFIMCLMAGICIVFEFLIHAD